MRKRDIENTRMVGLVAVLAKAQSLC